MSTSMPATPTTEAATDRRRPVTAVLRQHVGASDSAFRLSDESWAKDRFMARARALFYARLMFLTLGLLMLAVPEWRQHFGLDGPLAVGGYLTMLIYSIANYLVIGEGRTGQRVTYVTLCLDLLIFVALIAKPEVNGGLQSPFLATQLLYTTLFAILFPTPLAALPPLLALPVTTRLDLLLHRPVAAIDVLTLLWYSALNVIIMYVVVYMNEREASAHREIVQLQAHLKELAIVEERNRLAREVHDGIGGSLSSLIIQSEYLMGLAGDAELKREIGELKSSAEESIEELRRSLQMMREDFELAQSVQDYVTTFSERTQLPVHFEREGPPPRLPAEHQLTVFRVLQECLSNAARHAEARNVWVKLWFEPSAVHLSVRDDGKGFHPLQKRPGHYGLLHMRERAAKSLGVIVIDSSPGTGTQVSLSLPVESR